MPLLIETNAANNNNNNITSSPSSAVPLSIAASHPHHHHSRGLKDLFRVRRKSAVVNSLPEHTFGDDRTREMSPSTATNGGLGGTRPGNVASQARREHRSHSTIGIPIAAGLRPVERPQMNVTGGGEGKARQRRAANVMPQWSKPPLLSGQSATPVSSNASPMSYLLNPAVGTANSQAPPQTTSPSPVIGPSEFVELFRCRTNSDPRQAAAVLEARRRRASEVRAAEKVTSSSPPGLQGASPNATVNTESPSPHFNCSPAPSSDHLIDPPSQPVPPILATLHPAAGLAMSSRIPLSIPENRVVHHYHKLTTGVSSSSLGAASVGSASVISQGTLQGTSPLSSLSSPSTSSSALGAGYQRVFTPTVYSTSPHHQRLRKLSVFTPSTSAGGGGGGGVAGAAGKVEAKSRRYSEPFAPRGLQVLDSSSTRLQKRESVVQAMANFPKFTASSLAPAISPSSLSIELPRCHTGPLIIWKDRQRGTRMFRLPLDDDDDDDQIEFSTDSLASNRSLMFLKLLKRYPCYELMPNSSKLILLDTELTVIAAFYALIFNGIRAAPLWRSATKEVIGMLTVTDFIHVLKKFHHSKEKLNELEAHKISDWLDLLSYSHKPLVSIKPDDSLFDAVTLLHDANIHRLLVTDRVDGTVLYILTYKRILHFLYLLTYNMPQPSYMNVAISELGVGTYDSIATTSMSSTIIEALSHLVEHRVSALPVVDSEGRVLNVYSKADIINLVTNESYQNLSLTVEEALSFQRQSFEGLFVCKKTDVLGQVISWLVRMNIHRLIIADDNNRLEGILSLSDVVNFIVLKQNELHEQEAEYDDVSPAELTFDYNEQL